MQWKGLVSTFRVYDKRMRVLVFGINTWKSKPKPDVWNVTKKTIARGNPLTTAERRQMLLFFPSRASTGEGLRSQGLTSASATTWKFLPVSTGLESRSACSGLSSCCVTKEADKNNQLRKVRVWSMLFDTQDIAASSCRMHVLWK